MLRPLLLAVSCWSSASIAVAHEFWLSPESYRVASGGEIAVRLRVGEDFRGPSYVYSPNAFVRFDMVSAGLSKPVDGRLGDDPALVAETPESGLVVVVHETTDRSVVYTEWDRFVSFVEHKGYADAPARHRARGLPKSGFRERYRRFAKTLVAVGDGAGTDAAQGLRTEIVALANPYADDLGQGLPVLVMFEGAPRVGAQVELFAQAPDGTVTATFHTTDDAGRAILPVEAGYTYLVDSVVLLEVDAEAVEAVWESLWASLTFSVP
ncbi:MAG: DUF4198 domain-containing protein [Pseudomonadota bacterium]